MRGQMLGAAKIYFLVYGPLTIVGGLIGYLKAGSTISLISGGIAGALLIVAGLFAAIAVHRRNRSCAGRFPRTGRPIRSEFFRLRQSDAGRNHVAPQRHWYRGRSCLVAEAITVREL